MHYTLDRQTDRQSVGEGEREREQEVEAAIEDEGEGGEYRGEAIHEYVAAEGVCVVCTLVALHPRQADRQTICR